MTTDRTGPAPGAIEELVEQCRLSVARLRESWGWLALLVEPGRETATARVLGDAERAGDAARAREERADRQRVSRRPGALVTQWPEAAALAPTSAPVRVGVVDAQVAVHGLVLDVARRVAAARDAGYLGRPGDAGVLDALGWLDEGGPSRFVAAVGGVVWREPPRGVLAGLADRDLLAWLDARLARADRIARGAARDTGQTTTGVGDACPACGRWTLEWVMPGYPDPRHRGRWWVRCASEACLCAGVGCPCRQAVRYEGRRHAWSSGELAGPGGLWLAIAIARHRRQARLRSTRRGHGGWADRGVG
ncbi:MAG TPA: hypothetical protein VFM54_24425 [Micromonosporaceae bacterium]|nr:hypothetical protein [Micromonosporaceae bacterium]